jgi:hypothetical protein
MKHFALAALTALSTPWLCAQSLVGEPEFIRVQREALASQRAEVMAVYEEDAKACWQKFARKTRRASLEPLRQQDLLLNAQERQWRTEQRDLRLQGKQTAQPTPP